MNAAGHAADVKAMSGNAAEARAVSANTSDIKYLKTQVATNTAGHDSTDKALSGLN